MESRFAADFSAVRVHHDAHAAASARVLDARAYTVGADIVFSRGQYAPHAAMGADLLGHELAHVIQQSRGGPAPALISGGLERDADQAAVDLRSQQPIQVRGASALGVARQPLPGNAKHLRDVLGLDPRKPQDRQLAIELDAIEALLMVEQVMLAEPPAWTDRLIVNKALELQKNTGGKLGGAVLAHYDKITSKAVGSALAMATAPVVTSTDAEGKTTVLLRGYEAAQAPAKFQQEVLLGLLEGFAKAGLFGAGGLLAAELLMLAAVVAPGLIAVAGRSSAALSETGTALALRGAPRLMFWAARSPFVAEAAFTGGAAIALDIAETGSVDPIQVLFTLAHVYAAPRGGGGQRAPGGGGGDADSAKLSGPQWKWAQRLVFKLKLQLGNMQVGAGRAAPVQGLGSEPTISSVQPRGTRAPGSAAPASVGEASAPAGGSPAVRQPAAGPAAAAPSSSRAGITLGGSRPVLVNPAGQGAAWNVPLPGPTAPSAPVALAQVPGITAPEIQSLQGLSAAAWGRVTAYATGNGNQFSVKGKISEEVYFASAAAQLRFNQAVELAAALNLPANAVQFTQDVRGSTPSRTSGSGSGELGDGLYFAVRNGRLYVLGVVESKSPSNVGELGRKVTDGKSEHAGQPGWDFERLRELPVTVNGQTFQPDKVSISRHLTRWTGVLPKGESLSTRALIHIRTQLPGFETDTIDVSDATLNELARLIIARFHRTRGGGGGE